MNAAELERVARSVIPPVGASMAIAVVDEQQKHRAAFLIGGRIHGAPVGPAFDRPRDACRLVDILNGEASRPRLERAGAALDAGLGTRAEPEAPPATPGVSDSRCVVCQGPLPPGSRSDRRTCSPACRIAAWRAARGQAGANADGADPDSATAPVTPTRPLYGDTSLATGSGGPLTGSGRSLDPAASAAPSARQGLLGSARGARPDLTGIDPGNPTLGL